MKNFCRTFIAIFAFTHLALVQAQAQDLPQAQPQVQAEPQAKGEVKATEATLEVVESKPPLFRVLKMKGNKGIVEFSKRSKIMKVGEKGFVTSNKSSKIDDSLFSADSEANRHNFISLSTELSMLTTKTSSNSVKSDTFSLDVAYGWNDETIEYGGLFTYEFQKQELTDSKTLLIGGLFDYNFTPNTSDQSLIYGLRLVAQVGQIDNSGQSKAASLTRIEPGIFAKWFGLDANLALLGQLSYRLESYSLDSVSTQTSGLVGQLGVQAYF